MRVCIEGNIGCGKSSCLMSAEEACGVPCFPEPVDEWRAVLEKFYDSPSEWALAFSLQVLHSFRKPLSEKTCVVERSPLATRHVFGQVLYNDGVLNCHEWELLKDYHDVLAWTPDMFVYIDTPPEVCLERIRSRGRPYEKGIDASFLKKLDHQYTNMLRFSNVPVVRVDGTQAPHAVQAEVVRELRRHMSLGGGGGGQ